MSAARLLASAAIALAACAGGGGRSTPLNPPATGIPSPSVVQTIASGITPNAGLDHAVVGPDGRIWFSEFEASKLAAITTAGVVTEYALPGNAQPSGITAGIDGNIWTAGYGGNIYRVTTGGIVTAYVLAGSHVDAMVLGPDANVWFTDAGNETVGSITTAGIIRTYPVPAGSNPRGIARGADGSLWIADARGAILKLTTAGQYATYATGISAGASPHAIVAAPNGSLYFTEPFFSGTQNDRLGRVTTTGTITEIGALAPNTDPNDLALGKDGNVYFTEYNANRLGRIAIATDAITETPLAITTGSRGIVNGPDGLLWIGGMQSVSRVRY